MSCRVNPRPRTGFGGAAPQTVQKNTTIRRTITFADSPYTVVALDHVILADASGGKIVVELPALVPAGDVGRVLTVSKIDSSNNSVTLDPDAAETINGEAELELVNQFDSLSIVDGAIEWDVYAVADELLTVAADLFLSQTW